MAFLAGYNGVVYITSNASSLALSYPDVLSDSGDHTTFVEATASHRYWDDTALPTIQEQYDDVQTVSLTGSPTGGTFTLTFGAQTTTGIAYNASASTVQSALIALSSIGSGNVSVTGSNGGPWTVEFISTLGYASQSTMTGSGAGLTGGTSPGVSIVHTQTGQAWTTISATLYKVQYVGGKIIFTTAQIGTAQCRMSAGGKYFAYATFAQGTSWELDGTADMYDSTVFGGGRGKTCVPGLFGGKFMLKGFWVDATFLNDITSGFRLIFSGSADGTKRYESYSYTSADKVVAPVNNLITEEMEFTVTGAWYYN